MAKKDPRVWEITDIQAQYAAAQATGKQFFPVDIAMSDRKNVGGKWQIEFVVRDGDGTKYTIDWDSAEIWKPAPSTFPADKTHETPAPSNEPPQLGAWGRLYMTETLAKQIGLDKQVTTYAIKWPIALPATHDSAATLDLYPIEMTITGYELRSGTLRRATVNLLDPRQAAAHQTIALDGTSPVRLQVTQQVFDQLVLPFTSEEN